MGLLQSTSAYAIKLVLISAIILAALWSVLRLYGLSHEYVSFPHSFRDYPGPVNFQEVARPDQLGSLPQNTLPFARFRHDLNNNRFVHPENDDMTLTRFVQNDSYAFYMVEVINHSPTTHEEFYRRVKSLRDKILVFSPQDGFLKDLRKLYPRFIFSPGRSALTGFQLLSSVGLGPVVKLDGDFVVLSPASLGVSPLWTLKELKRQKKLLFWASPPTVQQSAPVNEFEWDGFIQLLK